MFAEERQHYILKKLKEKKKVSVTELCDELQVSSVTIRSDLTILESKYLLQRTHGGAIPVTRLGFNPWSRYKETYHAEEKERIAQKAYEFVDDGDVVYIDAGTTCVAFAKTIVDKKHVSIVTPSFDVALALEGQGLFVFLLGGEVYDGHRCVGGVLTEKIIADYHFDKAFISASGISAENGFTNPDYQMQEIKKQVIKRSTQLIIMSDYSKFGKTLFAKFGDITDASVLITDTKADSLECEAIAKKGVQVIRV